MAAKVTLEYEFLTLLDNILSFGSKLFVIPFINKSKLTLFGFYAMCCLVFLTCIQLVFTLCCTGFNDLMEVIDIAPNIGVALMSAIKYVKIHTHKKLYSRIFDHLRGNFWNLLPEHSEDNVKILNKYLKILQSLHRLMNLITFGLIIVVDSFPFLVMVYEQKILRKNVKLLYPFDAWYPFDKVKWYPIAYIWESIMTATVICLYSIANVIHLSYITFICMELKLLGCWLEGLITHDDITHPTNGTEIRHKRIHQKFNMITKRYNFLYE